ncbi:MAG: hypothetical protein P8I38_10745 [Arenicella sp.]|nr:hypothetical protein [Arenicella sp.]
MLMPFGIILMNLTLVRAFSFEVTVGTVIFLLSLLVFMLKGNMSKGSLLGMSLMFSYGLIGSFFAEDFGEFFRSFVLVILLWLYISVLIRSRVADDQVIIRAMKVLVRLTAVTAVLVLIDLFFVNILSSTLVSNPFGGMKSLGPGYEIYLPSTVSRIGRPSGLFSEPSVAAWVMALGCSVAIVLGRKKERYTFWLGALCFLGMLATATLSAFVNAAVLLLVSLYIRTGSLIQRFGMAALTFLVFVGILVLLFAAGVSDRLVSFAEEGTSTYYRVVAPFLLLSDSLVDYPFGHPLGQVEYIASKEYMINWAFGSQTNIDNSFLMVSFYFGIFGVIGGLLVFTYAAFLILKKSDAAPIIVAVLLMLLETGALWSPNVGLVIGFFVLIIRHIRQNESKSYISSPLTTR